jgi:hypothetical protein
MDNTFINFKPGLAKEFLQILQMSVTGLKLRANATTVYNNLASSLIKFAAKMLQTEGEI